MYKKRLVTAVAFLLGVVLLANCQQAAPGQKDLAATDAGSQTATATPSPGPTPQNADIPTPRPVDEAISQVSEAVGAEGGESAPTPLPTPTVIPTPTPGPLGNMVAEVTAAAGVASKKFLGLTVEDWINLGISVLIVIVGSVLGFWLLKRLLRRLVKMTATGFDDDFLEAVGPELRWLVVVFFIEFAGSRLRFLSDGLRTFLSNAYFLLYVAIGLVIAWKLLDFAVAQYMERLEPEERAQDLKPMVTLGRRVGHIFLVIIALNMVLARLGINVTALAATLGIAGLAISLAAQDTLADIISGFIILADRPFRMGDRIEITSLDTWGDVVSIGMRTTQIRTRDNRMVIVPNSVIGKSQVVNYTFPDPRYRVQTEIGIAFGTDIEHARQVMIDAVRHVKGVLPDKPVDALYLDMGGSAMTFRVRWWIESYEDTRNMFDRVHTALQYALDESGIESPFPTQSLIVHMESEAEPPAGES